jgi:hypothetical protein
MTFAHDMTNRLSRRPRAGFLVRLIAPLRAFLAELTSTYHPERHYMRGGGTGGVA